MRVNQVAAVAGVALLALAAACGSNSPSKPSGVAPRVTSLTPSQLVQGDAPQTVTVNGANFLSGLSVTLNDPTGGSRTFTGGEVQGLQATTFQLAATFTAAGPYSMQVKNQTGETSDPFSFTVQSTVGGTTPHLNSVTPGTVTHGANPQFLTIDGSNFSPNLTITMIDPTGQPVAVAGAIVGVVTSTSFQVQVALTRVGTYTLFVTNPTGEISNSLSIPSL